MTVIYVTAENNLEGVTKEGRPASFSMSMWTWVYDDTAMNAAVEKIKRPLIIHK